MTRLLFLSLLAVLAGCSGAADESDPSAQSEDALARGPQPRLAHLPNVDGIAIGDCSGQLSGCTLRSTNGRNAVVEARRVYDSFFKGRWPTSDEGWGFRDATAEERGLIGVLPPILPLPIASTTSPAPTKDEYKAWMALQPDPWATFERRKALRYPAHVPATSAPFRRNADPNAGRPNAELLTQHLADAQLASTSRARASFYQSQNPFDWLGAAATHYAAPSTARGADIMATNFVWRILNAPYQMEQALADCTADPDIPCVDSVAALSDLDLYRVYDLRLVRTPAPGRLQVSRVVRVVVVDSGHAIDLQSTYGPGATNAVTGAATPSRNSTPFLPTNQQHGPRLLWRLELGGQLARAMGAGDGSLASLVRYAPNNGETPADHPAPDACTDLNDGEWKCIGAGAQTKTVKCMSLLWQTYTSGCHIPGL